MFWVVQSYFFFTAWLIEECSGCRKVFNLRDVAGKFLPRCTQCRTAKLIALLHTIIMIWPIQTKVIFIDVYNN